MILKISTSRMYADTLVVKVQPMGELESYANEDYSAD